MLVVFKFVESSLHPKNERCMNGFITKKSFLEKMNPHSQDELTAPFEMVRKKKAPAITEAFEFNLFEQ